MVINRQHPILSPIALGAMVLLMAGVVVSVILAGGAAFSPGPLTSQSLAGVQLGGFASHADFENDCNVCHVPLQGLDPARCEACHTAVGAERASGEGLHGRLATTAACADCHPDHRGRDFDASAAALNRYDHGQTRFSLDRHLQDYDGSALACSTCHAGGHYAAEPPACLVCHTVHDGAFMADHATAFSTDCMQCHDGVDRWSNFHHAQTAFPLEGAHWGLPCATCHTARQPPDSVPAECAACHAEPAVHAGLLGTDCAACHTADGWRPAALDGAAFDHARTGFSLVTHQVGFDGAPLPCAACHVRGATGTADFGSVPETVCTVCHGTHEAAFMAEHVQQYGAGCQTCHAGTGLSLVGFDHSRVLPLDGGHAALACTACHGLAPRAAEPANCAACHAEPELHVGLFGTQCAACHPTGGWVPAALRQHTFPLDHGGSPVACATCHTQTYASYTCYGCHEHEPDDTQREHAEEGIGADQLADCAACHADGREHE